MRKILIVCLLIFSALPACALTWPEAVEIAEKNNPQLKSAVKDLESTEWSYSRSLTVFVPSLSLSAGRSESNGPTSYSYGLSARQNIFLGMEGIRGIQSAYASLELQRASLISSKASILYDIRAAFLELMYQSEQVGLLEQILEQRKENTRLIRLRYESGKEDKGNFLTTQADQMEAAYDLLAAKRNLELAQLKLSHLLGADVYQAEDEREVNIAGQENLALLIKYCPDLKMAEKTLELAELNYKESISGLLPSITLSASLGRSGDEWPPHNANNSWSLNLSYPFFTGGSNLIDRTIARVDLEKARQDFITSKNTIEYNIEHAYQSYVDAVEYLAVTRQVLEASQLRSQISKAKYLKGLTTYDEWYRLENTYISKQKARLSAYKQALLKQAAWYKSYGGAVE